MNNIPSDLPPVTAAALETLIKTGYAVKMPSSKLDKKRVPTALSALDSQVTTTS